MSDMPDKEPELWCPCCGNVRATRSVPGQRPAVRRLCEVFAGLEVEEGPDDPLVFAGTRRCACSAEWGSIEVPSYFLYQLLEERRLYREARQVAEDVLEHARTIEQRARAIGQTQAINTRSLKVSIHEAEALIKGLSARSDNYFLR